MLISYGIVHVYVTIASNLGSRLMSLHDHGLKQIMCLPYNTPLSLLLAVYHSMIHVFTLCIGGRVKQLVSVSVCLSG